MPIAARYTILAIDILLKMEIKLKNNSHCLFFHIRVCVHAQVHFHVNVHVRIYPFLCQRLVSVSMPSVCVHLLVKQKILRISILLTIISSGCHYSKQHHLFCVIYSIAQQFYSAQKTAEEKLKKKSSETSLKEDRSNDVTFSQC